jgi:hypothetical protein
LDNAVFFINLSVCTSLCEVKTIKQPWRLTSKIQSLMFSAQKLGVSPPESLMLSLNLKDDCSFYFGSTLHVIHFPDQDFFLHVLRAIGETRESRDPYVFYHTGLNGHKRGK